MQYKGCLLAVCKGWLCSATGVFMLSVSITTSFCEGKKYFVAGGGHLKAVSGLDRRCENDADF